MFLHAIRSPTCGCPQDSSSKGPIIYPVAGCRGNFLRHGVDDLFLESICRDDVGSIQEISRRIARPVFSQVEKALPAASIESRQSCLEADAEIPTILWECGFTTGNVVLVLDGRCSPLIKAR